MQDAGQIPHVREFDSAVSCSVRWHAKCHIAWLMFITCKWYVHPLWSCAVRMWPDNLAVPSGDCRNRVWCARNLNERTQAVFWHFGVQAVERSLLLTGVTADLLNSLGKYLVRVNAPSSVPGSGFCWQSQWAFRGCSCRKWICKHSWSQRNPYTDTYSCEFRGWHLPLLKAQYNFFCNKSTEIQCALKLGSWRVARLWPRWPLGSYSYEGLAQCRIWGSHSGECEDGRLMGCSAV
jgi:hypothetical protein